MKNKIRLFYEMEVTSGVTSYEESTKIISEKWGEDFSSRKPSHTLQVGDKLKIYSHKNKEIVHSHKFVDHNFESGRHLVNAYGLVVLEELDRIHNFIPANSFIIGIDSDKFLPYRKYAGRVVAVLYKTTEGEYLPMVLPHGMFLEHKEYFLVAE